MANNVKQIWAAGRAVVNGWLAIPSGFSAEVIAQCGFDSVTVDLQHGVQDYHSMVSCFQAMQAHPVTPMVRVPWNEPGIIMKCLDAGFEGVICPMVNTEDDARRLVAASRYAPLGGRSFGPTRASMIFGGSYRKAANDGILVIAMIETREALANLDAILKVEGIDGVYVGPSDLGLSMGHEPTLDPKAEEVLAAISGIGTRSRKAGKIAGCHCGSPAMVRRLQGQGFHFGSLLTDARLFTSALAAGLAEYRGTAAETVRGY